MTILGLNFLFIKSEYQSASCCWEWESIISSTWRIPFVESQNWIFSILLGCCAVDSISKAQIGSFLSWKVCFDTKRLRWVSSLQLPFNLKQLNEFVVFVSKRLALYSALTYRQFWCKANSPRRLPKGRSNDRPMPIRSKQILMDGCTSVQLKTSNCKSMFPYEYYIFNKRKYEQFSFCIALASWQEG